jgi:hypothetical protein
MNDEELEPRHSAEQPPTAEVLGVVLDNDQESHVSPSDNDGETVPEDEVDQPGG